MTRLTDSGKGIIALAATALAVIVACGAVALAQADPEKTDANDAKAPEAVGEAAQSVDSAKPSKPEAESYTFPISVSGQALDADGKPIAGAEIYIASQGLGWKRLAETKTDEVGKYQFTDVPLPLTRVGMNGSHDNGAFIVYGQSRGHGFAWRPRKSYYAQRNDNNLDSTNRDLPMEYMADDKIELDLHFSKSTKFAGRVINAKGEPIANTKLSIWDCERIPAAGYGSQRPFSQMDPDGFELLNAGVPAEIKIRKTDAEGRFEFADVPTGCRFRIDVQPPGFPARMIWVATRTGLVTEDEGRHLYDSIKEIELTFAIPKNVPIQVVYGDTGAPAAKAYVEMDNREGSKWTTSDDQGGANLSLPNGQFELTVIPAFGTPYLKTTSDCEVKDGPGTGVILATLRPAVQVEVHVVDEAMGKGIPGVDLWSEMVGHQGSEMQGNRQQHYSTSWEVATQIVHRDRPLTDENGIVTALFEPGNQRFGVAWRSYPKEYAPGASEGKDIECVAGEKVNVTFQLRKVSSK